MRGDNLRRSRKSDCGVSDRRNQFDTVSISRTIALECGVCAAFVFEDVSRWIRSNDLRGKHIHDGRAWMYDTLDQITADIGLFSKRTIQTALSILVQKEYLEKGNFNAKGYDRTVWYSLGKRALSGNDLIKQNLPHPDGKNCTMRHVAKIATPIPIDKINNGNNNNNTTNRQRGSSCRAANSSNGKSLPWPDQETFFKWLAEYCNSHFINDDIFKKMRDTYAAMEPEDYAKINNWKWWFKKTIERLSVPTFVCKKMREKDYVK